MPPRSIRSTCPAVGWVCRRRRCARCRRRGQWCCRGRRAPTGWPRPTAMVHGWSAALASGLTSLTASPQSRGRVAGDAADESLLGAHVTGGAEHDRLVASGATTRAQGLRRGRRRAVGGIGGAAEVDHEADALLAGLGRRRAADLVEGERRRAGSGRRLVGDGVAPAVDGAVLGDRLVRALLREGPGAVGELVEAPVAVGGGVGGRDGQEQTGRPRRAAATGRPGAGRRRETEWTQFPPRGRTPCRVAGWAGPAG